MVGSWPVSFLTGSRWKLERLGHMQFWTSVSQQTLYLLPISRDEDKTWAEERKCLGDLQVPVGPWGEAESLEDSRRAAGLCEAKLVGSAVGLPGFKS